jgi:hypothetical protein
MVGHRNADRMATGSRLRTGLVLGALAVAVAALLLASPTIVRPAESDAGPRTREDVRLVTVDDHEPRLWAYTSRQRDFGTATLPVNVVVEQDAATARRVIAADAGRNWTVDDPEGEALVVNGSGVAWSDTRGATRYTYVEYGDDPGEGGRWMDETAQLHDGAYLGARMHARLYEVEDGDRPLTMVQAHHEHWDWFRLRHTVGSVARGQYAVEHEFYGTGLVADVRRDRFGNGGASDADGWVTVVDLVDRKLRAGGVAAGLSLGLLFAGARRTTLAAALRALAERRQATTAHAALVGVALVTPLAVRVAAVGLERAFPALSPKVIAAPFYLVLAVGLPVAVGLLGRQLPADEAFTAAVVGFGAGLLLDYASLGISALTVGVAAHRAVLLVGLGLIAAGGVRWAETPVHRYRYRAPGILVWAGALAWPLAGL